MTFPLGDDGSAYNPKNFRKLTYEFVSLVMGQPFKSKESNYLWKAKNVRKRKRNMFLVCKMIIATLAHEGYKPDVTKGHGYLLSKDDEKVILAQKEILTSISSFLNDPNTFSNRINDPQYRQLVLDYFEHIINLHTQYLARHAETVDMHM